MPHVNAKVTAVAATSLGMSAAAAPLPRKWEGVDPALERMVLRACLDQAPERRRVREAFKDVQLNIDHCLFKAQYSDIRTTESYELNSRGVEIFSKCWFPENRRMKAIVCLCHGYGDTCTFFLDGIARKIASAGYGVFALDYPGFGLSEGLHGYIPSFDTLVDDVAETFAKVKGNPDYRGLPSFLFGQSMGGAVALKIHFKQPNEWSGAILVAPMCKMTWFQLGLFSKFLFSWLNSFQKRSLFHRKTWQNWHSKRRKNETRPVPVVPPTSLGPIFIFLICLLSLFLYIRYI